MLSKGNLKLFNSRSTTLLQDGINPFDEILCAPLFAGSTVATHHAAVKS
jgi:hypothetical protein